MDWDGSLVAGAPSTNMCIKLECYMLFTTCDTVLKYFNILFKLGRQIIFILCFLPLLQWDWTSSVSLILFWEACLKEYAFPTALCHHCSQSYCSKPFLRLLNISVLCTAVQPVSSSEAAMGCYGRGLLWDAKEG